MDKIKELVVKLENNIPVSYQKRIKALEELNPKVEAAKAEYDADQSDENKQDYDEIVSYVNEFKTDLEEDLEQLLVERKAEKTKTIEPKIVETKKEAKPSEKKELEPEKEGSGNLVSGIFVGLLLTGLTFGAYKYFKNN